MNCRLSEILGALSLATDLADGQPSGSAMSAAVISARIGLALGLSTAEQAELYYATLCRFIGCTATASDVAALGLGEEQTLNHCGTIADPLNPDDFRYHLNKYFAPNQPEEDRQRVIEICVEAGPDLYQFAKAHCEQATALTRRLPVPDAVPNILAGRHARWDGLNPIHGSGTDILLGTRIVEFAIVMELHRRAGGLQSTIEVASARSGSQFDPDICALYLKTPASYAEGLGSGNDWEMFLAAEPGEPVMIGAKDMRDIAEAFADFIDTKSPRFLGHSRNVAALAFRAAVSRGFSEADCQNIFNAGLLHDIGKSAIPNGIWDKTEPLSRQELQRAQTCSYHTEQILMTSPVFDALRDAACSSNERCDGSGGHRRIKLSDDGAALIVAANVYDELTRDIPGRAAHSAEDAAELMLADVKNGCLPREATRAVLENAGHKQSLTDKVYPDGLTAREAEVLMHMARGLSNKEIALKLDISPRTVDNHSQNLFKKIGAPGRTAAAMYAIEQGIFAA